VRADKSDWRCEVPDGAPPAFKLRSSGPDGPISNAPGNSFLPEQARIRGALAVWMTTVALMASIHWKTVDKLNLQRYVHQEFKTNDDLVRVHAYYDRGFVCMMPEVSENIYESVKYTPEQMQLLAVFAIHSNQNTSSAPGYEDALSFLTQHADRLEEKGVRIGYYRSKT
jgi:hypothetical protein